MDYSEIFDLINENLASGIKIPAIKHREVEHALLDYIRDNASQSGDIKLIDCDLTYYTDNFEVDGLGKNLRLGWAVCNGNNGTRDYSGRTPIGYGLGYSTFGAIGGETNHTLTKPELPDITIHIDGSNADNGDPGTKAVTAATQANSGFDIVVNSGGGAAHNNMQPYIVQLYIMKL